MDRGAVKLLLLPLITKKISIDMIYSKNNIVLYNKIFIKSSRAHMCSVAHMLQNYYVMVTSRRLSQKKSSIRVKKRGKKK